MAHAVAGQPVAVAWLCNVRVVVLVSSHCEASEALPRQLDAMGELAAHVLAAGKRLPLQGGKAAGGGGAARRDTVRLVGVVCSHCEASETPPRQATAIG